MALNFKKNLLIIMLLVIVILSTIVYINIQNIKETFISNRIDPNNIIPESSDSSYNYYKLNNGAYNYYVENIIMDPTNVYSSLNFVKTVTKDNFKSGIGPSLKNYFIANNAIIGYTKDNSSVQLYNVKPSVILDVNATLKSASSPTDICGMYMLMLENSGNLYDLCNNKLSSFNMRINNVDIIKSGVFQKIETKETTVIREASANTTAASASASIGDINFSGLFGKTNRPQDINDELFLYLLNQGNFGSSYVPPIYNNFETAMNLPSNPIVNPVNTMNPLEYAETLFAPQVTPMMAKNSYLNSDVAISATKEIPSVSAKDSSTLKTNTTAKDMFKFDQDGNLLSQNLGAKNVDDASNFTKVKTVYKESCAPCPAPQRCPESNFECKKVPNYEQGINNAFLPRPVLADFSTFGT
uniref:Uncharacterized protein n=1 Tax=viral metagenome TaxID=1070528 RepID=A0A6C0D646_9ZZZZ